MRTFWQKVFLFLAYYSYRYISRAQSYNFFAFLSWGNWCLWDLRKKNFHATEGRDLYCFFVEIFPRLNLLVNFKKDFYDLKKYAVSWRNFSWCLTCFSEGAFVVSLKFIKLRASTFNNEIILTFIKFWIISGEIFLNDSMKFLILS